MYLIYIDESGTPNFGDFNDYVLSALMVQEKQWKRINQKVNDLQASLFSSRIPEEFEFHASEITYFKRRYFGLPKNERINILYELARIINESKCYLITVIIDKEKISSKNKNKEWVEKWSWRLLFERLEKFLLSKNQRKLNEYGLICMDARDPSSNKEISNKMKNFVEEGSMFIDSHYLIEDVFFVDSEFRKLIQLVDFVAWISRKFYSMIKTKSELNNEIHISKCFELIGNKFDKNSSGSIFGAGIKIHPKT